MTRHLRRRATLLGLPMIALASHAKAQRPAPQTFDVTPPGPDTPRPLPGERMIGREDAPVTVIEFHSLTCGNCARFMTEIFPRIRTAFVEPGLVRFLLRDYPLDRIALDAAAMVHCAGPDRYEPLLKMLYANKESWAHSADPRVWLRRTGTLAGIQPARIDACWSDRGFTDPIIVSQMEASQQFGVNATPSFIIGGKLHAGVLTFEQFSTLVRPLLPPGTAPRG